MALPSPYFVNIVNYKHLKLATFFQRQKPVLPSRRYCPILPFWEKKLAILELPKCKQCIPQLCVFLAQEKSRSERIKNKKQRTLNFVFGGLFFGQAHHAIWQYFLQNTIFPKYIFSKTPFLFFICLLISLQQCSLSIIPWPVVKPINSGPSWQFDG